MGELGRAPAVVDGGDVAANLVLAVADDAAVAVALAGQLDDDLDRLAGLVLDGEDAAGVEVDLIAHGARCSGDEAGVKDSDLKIDATFGPGVFCPVLPAGGMGAELEVDPAVIGAPAVFKDDVDLEDQIDGHRVVPVEVGGG